MCRFSKLLLLSFFFGKDGSDRLLKRASFSCCNFLCVVLAAAYLKYRRCRLSCLPFIWHFFSLWHTPTHTHPPTNTPTHTPTDTHTHTHTHTHTCMQTYWQTAAVLSFQIFFYFPQLKDNILRPVGTWNKNFWKRFFFISVLSFNRQERTKRNNNKRAKVKNQ